LTRKKTVSVPIPALQAANTVLLAIGFIFALSPRLLGLGMPLLPQTPFFGWLGLALNLAGVAIAVWSRLALGRNWSGAVATVQEGHELVQSGPYALIRHPIYTGILLALAGTVLTYATVAGAIGLAAVSLALIVRVRIEDRLMGKEFGAAHEAYRSRTWKLIPLLW
jgi:protein-S-isoprenylcysteine O-methyltransferase Ste14